MRTKNSARNIAVSLIGQAVVVVLSFLTRSFFVKALSLEYLGVNGLFSNILSMLSLVELGIGSAITYSLYKPITLNDTKRICALMAFYKKTYMLIGGVVIAAGLCLLPFLEFFMKENPDIEHLKLYFMLYLGNTALSYFYVYKRSLIIANQNQYVSVLYQDIFYVIRSVAQIAVLLIYKSYFAYLAVQLVCTLAENIAISHRADKMYPYLKNKEKGHLDGELAVEIKKNTIAMIWHKIGTVVVMSTDNLLISKIVGLESTGLYSNYLVVTNSLNTVFSFIFNGVVASIGNLHVTESKERQREVFLALNFVGFVIYGVATAGLIILFNPFIILWLKDESYCLSQFTVLLIALNFYLYGMRRATLTYRNALGLYWYDRYKPVFECVVNLGVSIWLGMLWGIDGVFIGTAVSTLTTCFWIEPYVLYKYGFGYGVGRYFKKYMLYTTVEIVGIMIAYAAIRLIPGSSLMIFVLKGFICSAIMLLLYLICFFKTTEFKTLISAARGVLASISR